MMVSYTLEDSRWFLNRGRLMIYILGYFVERQTGISRRSDEAQHMELFVGCVIPLLLNTGR
jgi:hypothetical protein